MRADGSRMEIAVDERRVMSPMGIRTTHLVDLNADIMTQIGTIRFHSAKAVKIDSPNPFRKISGRL